MLRLFPANIKFVQDKAVGGRCYNVAHDNVLPLTIILLGDLNVFFRFSKELTTVVFVFTLFYAMMCSESTEKETSDKLTELSLI